MIIYQTSFVKMKTCSYALLVLILLLLAPTSSIYATKPIEVSPNTQSSPINFIIYFQLKKTLPSNSYLLFSFPPLLGTVLPYSCIYLTNNLNTVNLCENLQTGTVITTVLTLATINIFNPNINGKKTVAIKFTNGLDSGVEHSIQIILNGVLPSIGSITTLVEAYTISPTHIIYEQNWNFGQVYLQLKQNKILNVNSINTMTGLEPGKTFSNLLFEITIGEAVPTKISRLKLIISNEFIFLSSALVSVQASIGAAPQLISSKVVTQNIIIVTFNESFAVGRKFKITLTNIQTPLLISSGYISVYSLPDNSMSPLEVRQLSIPISTTNYQPILTVLTCEGSTTFPPVQFYTSTTQYIMVKIQLPRNFDSNFVILINSDTLVIHQGSVYAVTSTVQASTLNYKFKNTSSVIISGFPTIPSGSVITVTLRVDIPTNQLFNIYVSIDQQQYLTNPIIYGASATTSAFIPQNFITQFTGNQNQPNKLSWMKSTTSSILFTVNPSFQTYAASFLKIYARKDFHNTSSFNGATSCLVNSVAEPCSISSNSTFTIISLNSNSSYNLFPQSTPTTVRINDLTFDYASSHSESIYHFYFILTVSNSSSPTTKSMLLVPLVIPQRNLMTGLQNFYVNDLNNSGTNFPNLFRVVSSTPADWNYIIQSYEKRILSIFAYQGWKTLFSTLISGDPYVCGSSMSGMSFTYVQGTTSSLNSQYPLDWDRIDIILPGNQNSTVFSVVIPTLYRSVSGLQFQIAAGIYNLNTRRISYINIEAQPIGGASTYKLAANVSISAKTKVSTHKMYLPGRAGSYVSSVQVVIDPSSSSYSAQNYAAGLLIVSDWKFFDSTSSFTPSLLSSVNPIFSLVEQTPLSLNLISNYLTFIPFKTSGVYTNSFNISLNSIKLPYSHDLPYYSIYLVDDTGSIDSYNQFINVDQDLFYSTTLKSLSISCNDNSIGVVNTYCTVLFTPNQQLQVKGIIYISFTGMLVSTNLCEMMYSSTLISIPLSKCQTNTDKNTLTIQMDTTSRLVSLIEYKINFYGVSIQEGTINYYIDFSLKDSEGSYVIENGNKILVTSIGVPAEITIQQLIYQRNNPIVISGFIVDFTLPRPLNKDQNFAMVLSKDLSNLNTIPSKINIRLFSSNSTLIPALWTLDSKNYQIIFQDLLTSLTAGSYSLYIDGIRTASTTPVDLIKLIYIRLFDHTYTVANTVADFPNVIQKINSLIILQSYLNTEGFEQQISFNITNQNLPVDDKTQWRINLPRYYSPQVWNEAYLIYCMIQSSKLNCQKDPNTPYQIILTQSPRLIDIGTSYIIRIFGIPCPRQTYLNGNPQYVTESILMAISQTSNSASFMEYSQLFMNQRIINPTTQSGYGIITLTGFDSSNLQAFQSTYFTLNFQSSNAISSGQYIYLTFPQGFDNFNGISLELKMTVGAVTKFFTASVVNTRLCFQVLNMSVSAGAAFSLQISSLPTPKTGKTINMNKLKILISSSDKLSTTASSLELHNQAYNIVFVSSQLHLVINNYLIIPVTAGTYSLPIKITSSNGQAFLSNMKVDYVSGALVFNPSPTYMYLGDTQGIFSIGADQNIISTTYAFDIIKTETSISSFYSSLSRYGVQISNVPITVVLPSTINIPKGGCSLPIKVTLTNAPFDGISIYFQYDTTTYNLSYFWANEEISSNQLYFDKTTTSRWLSFCTSSLINATSFTITKYVRGKNQKSYKLSPSISTINIIPNTTTAITPSFNISKANILKTYASFFITTNIPGNFFYHLKLSPLTNPLTLQSIKENIQNTKTIIQSSNDYLSNLYETDRDERSDMAVMAVGSNSLGFDNLLPESAYTLCGYFENQHRVVTDYKCIELKTQTWGVIMKASIKFNSTLYENQLNNIFCFFVKAAKSQIKQIISLQGKSCALSSSSTNYNYLYKGITQSGELTGTNIYLFTEKNLTTDPSISLFSSLYNSTGITNASLSFALSAFSINYISSSVMAKSFNPITALTLAQDQFRPLLTFTNPIYSSNSVKINNLLLNQDGTVYFIMINNKKIYFNEITGHVDIDIQLVIPPSVHQVLNCMDGSNNVPIICKRVVLRSGIQQNVDLGIVSSNSVYTIYYLIANQYPIRPIIYGGVYSKTISTLINFTYHHQITILSAFIFLLCFS